MSDVIEAIPAEVSEDFKMMANYLLAGDDTLNVALLAVNKADSDKIVPVICLVEHMEDGMTRLKPIFELKHITEADMENYEEPRASGNVKIDASDET